jgi:uncharacterized protein
MSSLRDSINDTLKAFMREKAMDKLVVIRGLQAAIKQIEIDERTSLDDTRIMAVLEKQLKQRRESIAAFAGAGRTDLVTKEQAEADILSTFLPEALSNDELASLISAEIAAQQATTIKDMGKVMNALRPKITGRADGASVSALIKQMLGG